MRGQLKIILGAASLLALSACGDTPIAYTWTQEAGGYLDEGGFGNPTMNNTLVQTGQRSFVLDLNKRFSGEVPTTVNFAFNSSVLDETAKQTLRQQADWIRQFPEVRFKVFGHTDLVGSNAYNKSLGMRRAQSVISYLSTQGISRSRLQAVVSFGETQPLVVTSEPERRNRRTVTEVSGFVRNHPAVLNGKYAEVVFREYVESGTAITNLSGGQNTDAGSADQ